MTPRAMARQSMPYDPLEHGVEQAVRLAQSGSGELRTPCAQQIYQAAHASAGASQRKLHSSVLDHSQSRVHRVVHDSFVNLKLDETIGDYILFKTW